MKPKHRQVPVSTKVFFGLGMLAMQMFPAALGVFMVVLVQDFGFNQRNHSTKYLQKIAQNVLESKNDTCQSTWL